LNCHDVQELLHGYLDDEVDMVNSLAIEQHLQDCARCAQTYANYRALRSSLRTSALSFQAPLHLHKRVRSAVRRARRADDTGLRAWSWRWLGACAALVLIALALWRFWPSPLGAVTAGRLTQDLVASHIRSLMVSHLTDVTSTDQHTVKPWFEGKLDFAPVVADLTAEGFPLVGGRLDYLGNRPVAALVYRRRQHVINLFIWPAPPQVGAETIHLYQGYTLRHWTTAGMTYWAVSDLQDNELREFVHLVQQHTTPPLTPR
jgi:anti-sigma factor RsiW